MCSFYNILHIFIYYVPTLQRWPFLRTFTTYVFYVGRYSICIVSLCLLDAMLHYRNGRIHLNGKRVRGRMRCGAVQSAINFQCILAVTHGQRRQLHFTVTFGQTLSSAVLYADRKLRSCHDYAIVTWICGDSVTL